jgi:hypothetical protein
MGDLRVSEQVDRLRELGLDEETKGKILEILQKPIHRDRKIREIWESGLLNQTQIGMIFNLSQAHISRLVRGVRGIRAIKEEERRKREKEREEELKRLRRRAVYRKKLRDILEAVPHKADVDRIMEYYIRNREVFYNNPVRLFELLRAFGVGKEKAYFIVKEFMRKPWEK